MTKRFLMVAVSMLVAIFLFAACGGGTDEPEAPATPEAPVATPAAPGAETAPPAATPAPEGPTTTTQTELRIALGSFAVSMDPPISNDSASAMNNNMLYSTLVGMDYDTFEVFPGLAINWDMPDAATINMELRRGVTFHNGDPLTAYDVQFSLERASVSPEADPIVGMIDFVEVHDNYNFTIHLDFPFAPIMRHLAHTVTGIVPRDHFNAVGEEAFGNNPIGTGPFMFDELVLGEFIRLVRNDNYWGNVPVIETLYFLLIPDQSGRLIAVQTGAVDLADFIAPAEIGIAEASPDSVLHRRHNLSTNYIGFNVRQPYLENPLVRQAINYALDNQTIVDVIFMGAGRVANGPLAPIVWGFYATEPFTMNQARAQELMIEAGLPDGFSTTIWYNVPNMQRMQIAEMVQFALAPLNIDVEILGLEWGEYLERTSQGEHHMFILGWVSVTGDADYGLFPLFHSSQFGAAGNRTFWSTPELDALLEQGRFSVDADERLRIYREAQQIIRNEAPWVFINHGETLMASVPNLQGFTIAPWGHHNFAAIWFD